MKNNLTGKLFGRKVSNQNKKGLTTKPSRYFTTEVPNNESPDGFSGAHQIHTWPVFNKERR